MTTLENNENKPELEAEEKTQGEPSTETAPEKPDMKKRVLKEIREWVVSLAVALIVVVIVRSFLFTIIRVDGHSMDTTLTDNERLVVTILDMKLGGAHRDDVVICHYPGRGNTYFVKRVVGVPGDEVKRVSGVTYINGEPLDEMSLLNSANKSSDDYDYILGDDEYFCVGDNRYNSHDSRNWKDGITSDDVGPIGGDMLVGKVRFVIWPFNAVREVK